MRPIFSDTRIAEALQSWTAIAREIGVDASAYRHKLLWQKMEARRSHVVLQLTAPGRPGLILKRVFQADPGKDIAAALQAQAEAARRLEGRDGVCAPALLWMSGDGRISLMQQLPGKTLDDHLAEGKPHAPLLRRAGAWLSAFHETTEEGRRTYRPRFMVAHLARLRAQVERGTARVAEPDRFIACAARIAELAPRFEGRPSVSSAKHGDFNMRNLILGPDGDGAVDFHAHSTAPVGFDIARILMDYAELYQPPGDVPPGQVLAPQTLAAFFKGYRLVTPEDPGVGFLPYVQLITDWWTLPADPSRRSWRQALRRDGILALAARACPGI